MKYLGSAMLAATLALGACHKPSEPIAPDPSKAAPPPVETAAPTASAGGVFVGTPAAPVSTGSPDAPDDPEPDDEPAANDLHDLVNAPPDPIVESPGPAPSADQHWVEGYWRWDATHYVWEPGYWVDADDSAPTAPPAAPADDPGAAPGDGWVLMPGYWRYTGGSYLWMGGHWTPPRPGFDYVAPRWERNAAGRWSSRGGYWVPTSGARDDYQPAHPSGAEPRSAGRPKAREPSAQAPAAQGDPVTTGGSTYGESGQSLYGEDPPRRADEPHALTAQPRMDDSPPAAAPRSWGGRGGRGRGARGGRR